MKNYGLPMGKVVQCVCVAKMPFDKDGFHATGNSLTFETGAVYYEYENDDYDYSPRCRYLYELMGTEELVSDSDNKNYDIIFIVQKIVKNFRRGLTTEAQMISAFADRGISAEYVDNWIMKLEEYRLI